MLHFFLFFVFLHWESDLKSNSLVGLFNHHGLAVKVFSVFREDCVVGSLQSSFSSLAWGIASLASFCLHIQSINPGLCHYSEK
jgi:hypothetical protein